LTLVPVKLAHHTYGKTDVRLTKVTRLPDRHELAELTIAIHLEGDFDRSYTHGDNAAVIATDSIKNTVYVLAKAHPIDSPESFAVHLAQHFLRTYQQVTAATVNIEQTAWRRIMVAGKPHPTSFESAGSERRAAQVTLHREAHDLLIEGGLRDLLILKSTDSAFTGFVRNEYTTLPETSDRILATNLSATWRFRSEAPDFNATFAAIRQAMLETFANHVSDAVQQTLFAMAEAALNAAPSISEIHLQMPNKHRVPFNFKPFGLDFANDVFINTSEPSGDISATVKRN
jgi:urate oxidase